MGSNLIVTIIVVVYLLFMLWIRWYSSTKITTDTDFMVAGRRPWAASHGRNIGCYRDRRRKMIDFLNKI